jgi:SAM-dependent methyltransferase
VQAWISGQVHEHGLANRPTLEVGSLDVNGTTRRWFHGRYVGIDMRDGPGVDIVATADHIPFGDDEFDVVVSTEMLEHDPSPWLSMAEMGRVLKPGGHLLVTTRGNGFGLHLEPSDYWRYLPESMPILADLAGCDIIASREDPEVPGVFFHAIRR